MFRIIHYIIIIISARTGNSWIMSKTGGWRCWFNETKAYGWPLHRSTREKIHNSTPVCACLRVSHHASGLFPSYLTLSIIHPQTAWLYIYIYPSTGIHCQHTTVKWIAIRSYSLCHWLTTLIQKDIQKQWPEMIGLAIHNTCKPTHK